MSWLMLDVHWMILGRMYWRKASEDHRPNIMMRLGSTLAMKSAMAAPDRMECDPISSDLYPKKDGGFLLHVSRRVSFVDCWEKSRRVRFGGSIKELMGDSSEGLAYDNILDTVDASALTGHRIGWDVRRCVRLSSLWAFFWSSKQIWTSAASWIAFELLLGIAVMFSFRNVMFLIRKSFVLPRLETLEYSQLRQAKKNAAVRRCACAMRKGSCCSLACSCRKMRWLVVNAASFLTGGSNLSQARNRSLIL